MCSLLARFVDAPAIFIALKDAEGGRIVFLFENGVVEQLENRRVRPGSRPRTSCAKVSRSSSGAWKIGSRAVRRLICLRTRKTTNAFRRSSFRSNSAPRSSVCCPCKAKNPTPTIEADVDLLQTCALYLSVRIHQAQIETQSARLENIASTDSLTGVANRRWLNQRLSAEWRRAIRRRSAVAVMLIDVDFFKPFNDTYGHVAGDAALQQVATALSSCLSRPDDALRGTAAKSSSRYYPIRDFAVR